MRDAERLTEELAASLVAEQFPEAAGLPVELVRPGGHDNRTFRLARLAPVLPLPIPEVLVGGRPTAEDDRG